jgi:hypothetical protein
MDRAACREAPLWVDFVPIVERGEDPSPAQAYFAACPVTAQCLLWATARGEELGVWGGMTEAERLTVTSDEPPVQCPVCRTGACGEGEDVCAACFFTIWVASAS